MKTINIYSVSTVGNHLYECSTQTKLNCSQSIMQYVVNSIGLNNVIKHNKQYVHIKTKGKYKQFKNVNILYLYASYK